MTWKKIVVGYERNHVSAHALERAAEIAQAEHASLIVTSIARPLPVAATSHGLGPFDPADPPEAHRADLEHARELLENTDVSAEYEVEVGDPADAIVALADRRRGRSDRRRDARAAVSRPASARQRERLGHPACALRRADRALNA